MAASMQMEMHGFEDEIKARHIEKGSGHTLMIVAASSCDTFHVDLFVTTPQAEQIHGAFDEFLVSTGRREKRPEIYECGECNFLYYPTSQTEKEQCGNCNSKNIRRVV